MIEDHFATEPAAEIIKAIHELEDEFYSSDARYAARDLEAIAKIASDEFRANHPEIGEEAVKALAWCYTFDFK